MTKRQSMITALATVMFTASALGFAGYASAAGTNETPSWKQSQIQIKTYLKNTPGITGTVSVIEGNSITLNGKDGTIYTVDASTAKFVKNRNTVITISDIKPEDTLTVKGTISGTTVAATIIFDGKPITSTKGKGNFPQKTFKMIKKISKTSIPAS